jgi:hypothetical protein
MVPQLRLKSFATPSRPLDDFEPEPRRSGHGILDLMGVVACVGPNKFQPWKALADLVEDEPSPLSATGCRGSRRWGWPRGRAPRAAPYEVLPRCAPRPRRAGTAGRYCRPSSAEETGRAADTARDSPCVGDRRLRSSPRACPSCAAAPRTSRPGSTAPDAPTAHRSDRWEGPLPTACRRPMRLGLHPESKPPSHLGSRKSHPAPPARNFGSGSKSRDSKCDI